MKAEWPSPRDRPEGTGSGSSDGRVGRMQWIWGQGILTPPHFWPGGRYNIRWDRHRGTAENTAEKEGDTEWSLASRCSRWVLMECQETSSQVLAAVLSWVGHSVSMIQSILL